MKTPGIPDDECDRLWALQRLALLDTPPAESLDRVTRLTAKLLGVPIALVSLIDTNRQWFKSCVGLDVTETARDISFCGHAVFERRPLIVRDATADERFADNPLVTGGPLIRAYLGVPIFTRDEQPIGTLCAIDTRGRDWSDAEIDTLTTLGKIVEEDVHAKAIVQETYRVLQFARDRDRQLHDIFEQSAVGIAYFHTDGRLMRINRRACDMLGYAPRDLRTASLLDFVHPEDAPEDAGLLQRMLAGNFISTRTEKRLRRKDGLYLQVMWTVDLRCDDSGKPDYAIAVLEQTATQTALEATG